MMRIAAALVASIVLSASWAMAGDPSESAAVASAGKWTKRQLDFFENRIRPVLVEHCYECHAGDAGKIKGGLSLEHRSGLLTGGDSGPAIVPGKPDASPLIEALRYDGFEMPPAGRLPDDVVRDFEQWVKMGAPDPRVAESSAAAAVVKAGAWTLDEGRQFWAFQAPVRHPTPEVANASWPATWIDRFVLARLETAGLEPAADVDRLRLLRRLTFDLTGLPPTLEQMDEFLADTRPDAVPRLVDRLLDSPQFGEHWGRHWLDVARYADSNGSDFNATFHDAWRYRNYVIDAFNRDKPFNQFVREQIAGDLLPYDNDQQRADQVVATGFLMLGAKMLSERDKLKLRMDVVDEQVDTVGRAFMGMTLGCARCHDHKFDPIPTADYYALAGIFRSTQTLDGESQQYVSDFTRQPLPLDAEHAALLARLDEARRELESRMKVKRQEVSQMEKELGAMGDPRLGIVIDDDDAVTVGNWAPTAYTKGFVGRGYRRFERNADKPGSITYATRLPATGEYEVRASYTAGGNRASAVPVRIEHAGGTAEATLNEQQKPPIDGLYASLGRYRFLEGEEARVTISTEGTDGYVLADAVAFVPIDAVVELAGDEASSQARRAMQTRLDSARQAMKSLEDEMQQLEKQAPPKPLALAVREESMIENSPIYVRGETSNAGPVVERGFLQVASWRSTPKLPADESGRRQLADWLADANHPLTARVIANRIWYYLLGEGLVRSVDNFGVLGELPTHPELLDRLALEMVDGGWSVKNLVRQIVLSRVYQLDTAYDARSWNADPENRLLWRAHRRSIPAEGLRDAMLLIGGQLDFRPNETPVAGFGTLVRSNSGGDEPVARGESLRRTIYLPIIRNELPALLTVFDFADPDFVNGQRARTNVPAQALFMLNSPFVRQCAERAAQLTLEAELADDAQRVQRLYRSVLSRDPTSDEIRRALHFVRAASRSPEQLPPEAEVVETATAEFNRGRLEAWSQLTQALIASTEYRFLD